MGKELSLIARGAGFYFAGFAISKVLAYFYTAMLARGLGVEAFGIFSIGVVITGIILVAAGLGLYSGILHFVAVYDSIGQREKARGTILLGLKAQLVSSIVLAAALFVLSDYIAISFFREAEIATVFRILALAMPFAVLTSALMMVAQAFKKIEYKIYVRNVIENIAKILFTGVLLFLGFHIFGAAVGLAISSVVAFFFSLYFVQKKVFPLFGKGAKAEYNVKELFSYSWPLLAVGFFEIIMYSIDTIMLGSLSKAYDAGLYNVAHPTASLLVVAPFAFGALFLPIITGLYAQKRMPEFNKTFKVVSRWIFAAIFPCLLFTALFAGDILTVMFGAVYAEGATALIILALGIFMVSFVGPVRSILESVKRTKLIFLNTLVSGAVNITLNFWLIPLFGSMGIAIVGAAIATAASYFLWNLLALAEVFLLVRIHPYSKAYTAPTIAACAAIAVFYFLKQAAPRLGALSFPFDFILLVAFGSAFLCLYAVLFIILRGIQSEDMDVLRAFENKAGIKVEFLREFIKRFS